MRSAISLPKASSREYPNVRSAAGLNSITLPSASMARMESKADSTMALPGGGPTARRGYTEWFATAAVTHPISPQPATGSTGGPAPVRAYMEELLPGILEGTPGPHDP